MTTPMGRRQRGSVHLRRAVGVGAIGLAPLLAAAPVGADVPPQRPVTVVFGGNGSGQLGTGTTAPSTTPVALTGFAPTIAVAAGNDHSLAVGRDGSVWAWGKGASGQLGTGGTTSSSSPVAVPGLSGPTGARAVAAGARHSLAALVDGSVRAWGDGSDGQLGDGARQVRTSPVVVSGLTDVVAVAAGARHSLALRSDGTVWAWGDNNRGQLGTGTTAAATSPARVEGLSDVEAIAAGAQHSLAVTASGTVWAWGDNADRQLGSATAAPLARVPMPVPSLVAANVAGGLSHSMALGRDGSVWTWGANSHGQLGNGTTTPSAVPVKVNLAPAISISASDHSVAVAASGRVSTWGDNTSGQLGTGTTTDGLVPASVGSARRMQLAAAGRRHTIVARPSDLSSDALGIDLGPVDVGSTVTREIRVTNTSRKPLSVQAARVEGPFSVSPSTPLPASIAPGAAVTITVSFTPTALGVALGRVVVPSAGGDLVVAVTGIARDPAWAVSPDVVVFGSLSTGTVRSVVSITNPSSTNLTIDGVAITGAGAPSFAIVSNSCTAVLEAQSTCVVVVSFTASGQGATTARLAVTTAHGTAAAVLAGTGLAS